MNSLPICRLGLAVVLAILHAVIPVTAEEIRIVPRLQPTNLFGERDARFEYQLYSPHAFEGTLRWRLSASNRTVAYREETISLERGKAHSTRFECTLPPVKAGVVVRLDLRIAIVGQEEATSARLDVPIYLFPDNPFFDRREWLESLRIKVFDPVGDTATALKELEVPFQEVTNIESLTELRSGVLVVGEGIDWNDYGKLGDLLLSVAQRGAAVICLAPAAGDLPLPLEPNRESGATSLLFRRRDVVQQIDRRLSLASDEEADDLCNLKVAYKSEEIVATTVEPGSGWPWLEIQFAEPRSRLTWCGLGLIRDWATSPTSRYLLARLLETTSPGREAIGSLTLEPKESP